MLKDVLWSTLSALIVGLLLGRFLARIVHRQRFIQIEDRLLDDFLGLGLIGVVYGVCLFIESWGFLGVFAAALSFRQSELKLDRSAKSADGPEPTHSPPAQKEVSALQPSPQMSKGSLEFKESLERLSEVALVLLLGGMLFTDSWSVRAVGLALFLFTVVRPVSVLAGLIGSGAPMKLRLLIGWFGVRGIGSIYYLMFAIVSGLPEELAVELIHFTLIVIVLSIIVHGLTVKPMMAKWWT